MFKNGEWVKYDGSDVDRVIIEETITLEEYKKRFPEAYWLTKKDTPV